MQILIDAAGLLTPCCSKNHIIYTFDLRRSSERLDFHFTYEPKYLDDREQSKKLIQDGLAEFGYANDPGAGENWESFLPVQNLLTLSVDSPEGFRGCAHRMQPKQDLFLARESASSGFILGEIGPGLWKVTVSVHLVATPECRYHLLISEGIGDQV